MLELFIPGGIGGSSGIDESTVSLGIFALLMIVTIFFIVGGSSLIGKGKGG